MCKWFSCALLLVVFGQHGTAQDAQKDAPVGEPERVGSVTLDAWLESWRNASREERDQMGDGFIGDVGQLLTRADYDHIFELLKSSDAAMREAACALLRFDNEDAETIATRLEPLLDDPDEDTRFRAAATIVSVAYPRPKAGYDVLLEFAKRGDPGWRLKAIRHLSDHARLEPRVVDLLIDMVIDGENVEELELRRVIADGLVAAEEERATEALRLFLHDSDDYIRMRASSNLAFTHPDDDEVASVLLELMKNGDSEVRTNVANVLGGLGPDRASDTVPLLVAALHDEDAFIQGNAAASLGNLGTQGVEVPEAVPGLIELTKSKNSWTRSAAAFALGNVGAEAAIAVPALSTLVQDPDARVRGYALASLKEAGTDIVIAMPQLIAALGDRESSVRQSVAGLIALGGPASKDAVSPLAARLADPVALVRIWAAYALREIGEPAATALPDLMKVLAEDPDPKVRVETARTLAGIGSAAGAATDALVAACGDPEVDVRLWALFALGEVKVKNDAVLATLQEAARSSDARVLAEANKALEKLGETHDQAAIANAPVTSPVLELVSSFLDYRRLALVFSDARGAGVVDLLGESGGVEGKTERRGLAYRWRYLAKDQAEAIEGESEVHSVSHMTSPGFFQYDSEASMTTIRAGPLHVDWSYGAPGFGYIYWRPENVRVEPVIQESFESIDLRRFIR